MAPRRNKRADYLVTRFETYEGRDDCERANAELLRMGAAAVPSLIAFIDDKRGGWNAAAILCELGAPAAVPAIPRLLVHAKNPKSGSAMWSAKALGALGQMDALVELAKRKSTRWYAVTGLASARPASYAIYERLLDREDRALAKMIADELSPGSASWSPRSEHVDAIVGASRSKHIALRKDAACALSYLRTGADRARSVAPLVALLADSSSEVRRLALMALGDCRGHAKGALPQIRACLKDRVAIVRANAKSAIAEIEKRRPGRP